MGWERRDFARTSRAKYIASIRDGREVWINGERVRDVTTHPAFRPAVDIRARIYDMAHDPATRDRMSYEEDGRALAIGLKLPSSRPTGRRSATPSTAVMHARLAGW